MPKYSLKAGAEIEMLSRDELNESLARYFANRQAAQLRGIKHLRLPTDLSGKASSNKLNLSVPNGQIAVGPRQGYIWTAKRLGINGMQSGATPDTVNLYFNDVGTQIQWVFDGNHPAYTFGKLEVTLYGGETFALASSGTFNATGTITLVGEVIEVPAELIGKLA